MSAVERSVLTLVRHGETSANVEGVWHGSTDTALTELGQRQAVRVAEHLSRTHRDACAVYSSPLERARHTAAPIAAGLDLEVQVEEDLREYHLGEWEGVSYAELTSRHRLFKRMQADPDWKPGGGESARQVAERLSGALQAVAHRHPGRRVVVVSHGGGLTLALGLLLDRDPSTWRRVMSNCAVTELAFEPEPRLLAFNETQHLEDA